MCDKLSDRYNSFIMDTVKNKGISVIVCCFNSSARIRETLRALCAQELDASLDCEIILVDNASTDNTSEVAYAVWKNSNTRISLRIIPEMRPGLAYARRKGIKASLYNYLIFCDDDNWLEDTYVQTAFSILDKDQRIAACGGKGI